MALSLFLSLPLLGQTGEMTRAGLVSVKDFRAVGDGVVNDTANIQAALNAALPGSAIYFPPGHYAVCSLTAKGTNLMMYGSGMFSSMLVRHSSCRQSHTNMVNVSTTSMIIRDLGFDMFTDGSYFGNSIIDIAGASSVDIGGSFFTHAQAVGIQVSHSDKVRIHDNYFRENWWFGISLASGGTTASPIFNHGFTVTGNLFENTPIGLGFSFFLSDIAVSGNVFVRSNLSLVQMPQANAAVTGNNFDGSASYGCGASCSMASHAPGIFLEGVSDFEIGSNSIHAPSGSGILCQGSNLTIPGGGRIMQLPCNRGSIHGNTVSGAANDQPILISAAATDGTPGSQIMVDGNQILNSHSCITVAGAKNVQETNNQCDTTALAGYYLSGVIKSVFRGNSARNVGSKFNALEINGASQDLDIDGNSFICDAGPGQCMRFGVHDATLEEGGISQIRHCGNTIRGAAAASWSPLPAIPSTGSWNPGDCIENFPFTETGSARYGSNQLLGWRNIQSGSPGVWTPFGTISGSECVTIASPALCHESIVGSVAIAPGKLSLKVNSAAVGIGSHIFIQEDYSLGQVLKVDCNSGVSTLPRIESKIVGNSFTIALGHAPISHFGCYSFWIRNEP
jgi:hypothetical protein